MTNEWFQVIIDFICLFTSISDFYHISHYLSNKEHFDKKGSFFSRKIQFRSKSLEINLQKLIFNIFHRAKHEIYSVESLFKVNAPEMQKTSIFKARFISHLSFLFDFNGKILNLTHTHHFILVMEGKDSTKTTKEPTESNKTLIPIQSQRYTPLEKGGRKLKKDRLKDKKKGKGQAKADTSSSNHQNQLMILNFEKPFPQVVLAQTQSEASKDSSQHNADYKSLYSFEKILKKPTYLSVTNGNRIVGHFGHATFFFKRPILQGQFFMEFIYCDDKIKNSKLANKPSLRVGVCNYAFNSSFPLGWEDSVGYKSSDGGILHNGEIIHKGEGYQNGDVIGVSVKMSPPYKHPDVSKTSEGSSVTFYKNGKLVYSFKKLKQTFYCFAASTYNYSQVQISNSSPRFEVYEGGKPYFECLGEKIQYKDLQDSGIFKV